MPCAEHANRQIFANTRRQLDFLFLPGKAHIRYQLTLAKRSGKLLLGSDAPNLNFLGARLALVERRSALPFCGVKLLPDFWEGDESRRNRIFHRSTSR
jgi:hypothetical protein